jgi:hypothetical protein
MYPSGKSPKTTRRRVGAVCSAGRFPRLRRFLLHRGKRRHGGKTRLFFLRRVVAFRRLQGLRWMSGCSLVTRQVVAGRWKERTRKLPMFRKSSGLSPWSAP